MSTQPSHATRSPSADPDTKEQVDADHLLTLLDAEYTRDILEAINAEAKSARSLIRECDASRATVYRRLNDLEAAGVVGSELRYDHDGHHRAVYRATLEMVSVSVTADGLSATASAGRTSRKSTGIPGRVAGR
ncbi:MAG: ArsR family transcriptional regulator [Haloferacaceae archaeon]